MECKTKFGLDVLPIFYHVDPSDVRKQQNSFFEAFSIHEVKFKHHVETVKNWREALKHVTDLAGVGIGHQNEASHIKMIADHILKKLPVKDSNFRKSLVGIESRISKIKKLMDSKPNDVLFIGLWGMGGIGKTTTAKAIFEDCRNAFEGSCFLKDVRQRTNIMEDLQKNLLTSVLNTEVNGEVGNMIPVRLRFKKILLVIDDVDDKEQIDALAGHCDWFGKGSIIIITTRDAHLLSEDHIEIYNVQTLPQNEALQLFCLHAFKNEYPREDFKEISLQVLSYVGGLPLALRVLGCHLLNRKKYFWEAALKKFKDKSTDKIIDILKISFDGLDDFQKDIFLDIACFFRRHSKDGVEERLESLGLHPKEGIDVLIQKSLISISFNVIEMHDLLQEMGWYIIRQRSNWDVKKYSHLWLKKDIQYLLSDINIAVSSEAERICISHDDDISFNLGWDGAFRNMNKLIFLELSGDLFEGDYEDVDVSPSFCQHYNKLRWFSWKWYPRQSLPKSFHPSNLIQLRLKRSRIKETPDFSHMPNLEVLNLCWSDMLVYIHPSLGDHMKIKHIDLSHCTGLKEFPNINQMKSLEILSLSYTGLQSLPEIYGDLDSLWKLDFWRTSINGLPSSIVGNATRLQKLRLACLRYWNLDFLG